MKNQDKNVDEQQIISNLNKTALRVFLYALKKQQPIGVRETQRALGFKVPSHAQYHLQKLEQLNILKQIPGTKYELQEPYKNLKNLKVSILTEIYLINGNAIPIIGFLSGYSIGIIIITWILYTLTTPLITLMANTISLALMTLLTANETRTVLKTFKNQE